MDISAQVRILRSLSFECHCQWKEELEFALSDAADTIEALSAKLQAANMERTAEDCGGWIYCGDGENLPAEPSACIVTVIDTEPMTQTDFESILPYHVGYGGKQWNDIEGNQIPFEVIAWMYAPKEPYHEPWQIHHPWQRHRKPQREATV